MIRDLDPKAHDLLKRRAEGFGRSLQAEVKMILELAARASDLETAHKRAEEIRASLAGRTFPDSAEVVREGRDG